MAEKPKHGGPRKGAGRPKAEKAYRAVKLEIDLASKAFMIAHSRGTTIADYLSVKFRGGIEKDYAQLVREAGGQDK